MGVTIHYEGKTDLETAKTVVDFVKQFAEALHLPYRYYGMDGVVAINRIYKQNGEIYHEWFSFYEKEFAEQNRVKGEESVKFGVVLNFKPPVQVESLDIGFYKHGNDWVLKGFCKTQVFNSDEMHNLYAHIVIVSILMTIKHTWIKDLEIFDEGSFYLPIDERERERYVEEHITEEYRDEYSKLKPFDFRHLIEAHGCNLEIINAFADALRDFGVSVSKGSSL